MTTPTQCECSANPLLIFSCSGGSDAGETADRAARLLTREGIGKMFCLAGLGGKVEAILNNTRKAKRILVIDGCPQQCARKTLEQAGISKFKAFDLSSIGLTKGKSPATEENISKVADQAKRVLVGCSCGE